MYTHGYCVRPPEDGNLWDLLANQDRYVPDNSNA